MMCQQKHPSDCLEDAQTYNAADLVFKVSGSLRDFPNSSIISSIVTGVNLCGRVLSVGYQSTCTCILQLPGSFVTCGYFGTMVHRSHHVDRYVQKESWSSVYTNTNMNFSSGLYELLFKEKKSPLITATLESHQFHGKVGSHHHNDEIPLLENFCQ